LLAKNNGFKVSIGGDWGTFHVSDEATYTKDVVQEATWSQAHGIYEQDTGNEQDGNLYDLNQTQWEFFLNNTVTPAVRAVYGGKIGYTIDSDYAAGWEKSGVKFDLLGLNVSWSRLSGQLFRVDKWSVCQG
jgi:hypothetical protein